MSRLSLLAGCLLLSACQASLPPLPAWQAPEGRDAPLTGQIIDLHNGQSLSPAELVKRLQAAPRIVIGEQHDNPDHHSLQRWLLRALDERSVLLEMLQPVQQAQVAATQQQVQAGSWPEDLPKALNWQHGWDWQQYGPLVMALLPAPAPLLAANLEREEMMAIYRQPPELSGAASTQPAVRAALTAQIRDAHCGMLPETQLPAMLAIQQQRDRRMAERLLAAEAPAVLLAGNFHARRDLGVPLHVQDLGSEVQVVILAGIGEEISAQQGDFVWYTPATAPEDYCAQLRKR